MAVRMPPNDALKPGAHIPGSGGRTQKTYSSVFHKYIVAQKPIQLDLLDYLLILKTGIVYGGLGTGLVLTANRFINPVNPSTRTCAGIFLAGAVAFSALEYGAVLSQRADWQKPIHQCQTQLEQLRNKRAELAAICEELRSKVGFPLEYSEILLEYYADEKDNETVFNCAEQIHQLVKQRVACRKELLASGMNMSGGALGGYAHQIKAYSDEASYLATVPAAEQELMGLRYRKTQEMVALESRIVNLELLQKKAFLTVADKILGLIPEAIAELEEELDLLSRPPAGQ